MLERGYLGIDECNAGSYPQVLTSVFSTNPQDIEKIGDLQKISKHRDIQEVLEGRMFKYILILKGLGNSLNPNKILSMVYSEFIKSFGNLELVLSDGEQYGALLEDITMLLNGNVPKIRSEPKADETYKIVNVADFIANKLYHKLIRHGSISGYDGNLIVLDVRAYYDLFRK